MLKRLFFAERWNIGYVRQTVTDLVREKKLKDIQWMKEDDSDYSADPFIVKKGRDHYVYYEYLNFWEGQGRIYRFSGFDFTNKERVTGISNRVHLSYPYLFEDKEILYCIPESADLDEVALYRVDTGTSSVIRCRTLLSGAPYVDSSLIAFGGMYWLFTTRKDRQGQLFIFCSSDLDGEFTAHKQNPIQADSKSTRSAGNLFIVDGKLYRPSQDLSKQYGGAIIINEVTGLSPERFCQEACFEIRPQAPYNEGIHNLSFCEDMIVVDGKRNTFSLMMPIKKIANKYRKKVKAI